MSSPSGPESVLKLPLDEAQRQLAAQIDFGRNLLNNKMLGAPEPKSEPNDSSLTVWALERAFKLAPANRFGRLEEVKNQVLRWCDDNRTWLDRNLGGEVAELYRNAHTQEAPKTIGRLLPFLSETVESEIAILQSIHDRLAIWVPKAVPKPAAPGQPNPGDPIFIVHGSDTLRAERVARLVTNATGHDTIILREQPSLGQTLIEKFEQHATTACYAVVILTPDDEGGRQGQNTRNPRGRQNVIFEMGYFYGILGRSRVSVLLYQGVEKPSDVDGVAYIDFDDHGAWKMELLRELQHAQIRVDMSRAF
jgi:predicted nucleotide-binding protein